MNNRFFIILLGLIILVFGAFFITKDKAAKNQNPSSNTPTSNHVTGAGQSGVTLVEYGDFQCSACYQYEPIMREIRTKYGQDIFFQFKHFPLVQIHKNALIAAKAAEAAGLQGKFWEMHDLLYQTQDPSGKSGWVAMADPTSTFKEFATTLGLDAAKFATDIASSQTNDIVLADLKEAQGFGFNGTPSFTLNGQKIERPASAEEFYKLIENAITQSKKQ